MKNKWLNNLQQGAKRKWLLSAFYCVLLSISYLMDTFNPAAKRMLCQDFNSPADNRAREESRPVNREKNQSGENQL
jgi:hypothetical protein